MLSLLWEDENAVKLIVMVAQLCKYIKIQWLCVELFTCLIYKLNLNKAIYQPSIETQICLSNLTFYLGGLRRMDGIQFPYLKNMSFKLLFEI